MSRLEEIKERASKATPGPWEWDMGDGSLPTLEGPDGCYQHVLSTSVCKTCYERKARCLDAKDDDKAFIAESRSDIPWLIENVEGLVRAARAAMDRWRERDGGDNPPTYKLYNELEAVLRPFEE